jgi:hypothetical protein
MGRTPRVRGFAVIAGLVLAIGSLTACGDDEGSSEPAAGSDTGMAGTTVAVTVQEFAVAADPGTAPAGTVTFEVTNEGPDDVHEFVVIKTDLGPTELPTDDTGAVIEDSEGMEVIDEIEDIPVGETPSVTTDLEAGAYVLICNIYDEEEQEAHYSEGMRIGFTVE